MRNNDSNSIVKKQRMVAATRSNHDERRIDVFSPACYKELAVSLEVELHPPLASSYVAS